MSTAAPRDLSTRNRIAQILADLPPSPLDYSADRSKQSNCGATQLDATTAAAGAQSAASPALPPFTSLDHTHAASGRFSITWDQLPPALDLFAAAAPCASASASASTSSSCCEADSVAAAESGNADWQCECADSSRGHAWMLGRRAKNRLKYAAKQQELQRKQQHESPSADDITSAPAPIHISPLAQPGNSSAVDEHGAPSLRVMRKRAQVDSFASMLGLMIEAASSSDAARRPLVVDFGCGTGSLVLPLAWRFADSADFIAVDMNAGSLKLLATRAARAGLNNLSTHCSRIDEFECAGGKESNSSNCRTPSIVLALHACGPATDHALRFARRVGASFIVSPCCIGKIASVAPPPSSTGVAEVATVGSRTCTDPLRYPQSQWLRSAAFAESDFMALARLADHHDHNHNRDAAARLRGNGDALTSTVSVVALPPSLPPADCEELATQNLIALARSCKWHMETDRLAAAHDEGYTVWRLSLLKFEIAPSNKTVRNLSFFRRCWFRSHVYILNLGNCFSPRIRIFSWAPRRARSKVREHYTQHFRFVAAVVRHDVYIIQVDKLSCHLSIFSIIEIACHYLQ